MWIAIDTTPRLQLPHLRLPNRLHRELQPPAIRLARAPQHRLQRDSRLNHVLVTLRSPGLRHARAHVWNFAHPSANPRNQHPK